MSRFVCLIVLCFYGLSCHAQISLKDYWTVEEYFSLNPEQKERSEAFNLRVHSAPPKKLINKNGSIKISVVYPGEQVSDYWRRSVGSLEARLDELGVHYQLEAVYTKPGTELIKQAKLIQSSISENTDYLVFTLDALRHKTLVEQIISKRKTKLILQNITTPLKVLANTQPFLYVGFDHQLGTEILVKEYLKRFPNGARYGLLYGTKGYVSTMRGDTFTSALNRKKGYEMVASYYVNFDRNRAYRATKDLISRTPDIDFIYAASTDIALGAIDYLTEAGLKDKIIVNGWGGGSAELHSLEKGQLDFTVMRMNDDNGVAMAEAIVLDTNNQGEQVPLIYSGDFQLITQAITKEALETIKAKAFRYSGD